MRPVFYTSELFPTSLRGNVIGMCTMANMGGAIISPLFIALQQQISWLPGSIFGCCGILGGVFACFLKETRNQPLLMTIEQAIRFYEGKAEDSRPTRKPRAGSMINTGFEDNEWEGKQRTSSFVLPS